MHPLVGQADIADIVLLSENMDLAMLVPMDAEILVKELGEMAQPDAVRIVCNLLNLPEVDF